MTASVFDNLEFISIPAGTYRLGWSADSLELEDTDWIAARLSPVRSVTLEAFEISTTTVDAERLLASDDDDVFDDIDSLEDLCDALSVKLAEHDLRMPTEDELEAACGGFLFGWGDQVPDGNPYGTETEFRAHLEPFANGIVIDPDTYKVEIVHTAFKLGDGGEALCGGYEWPLSWLSLSPRYRIPDEMADETLFEYFESARVRPVKAPSSSR